MSLNDIYYNFEEKWYKFVDKVDEKIPVYGLVEKIDSIVPSFLIIIILFAIILLMIIFNAFNLWESTIPTQTTFIIKDSANQPVWDTLIELQLIENGEIKEIISQRTDNEGKVVFDNLKIGQEVILEIDISKGTYKNNFYITRDFVEEITLREKIELREITRTVIVKGPNGNTITIPLEIEFFCENRSVIPTPQKATTSQGQIEVTEPLNCIKLLGKPISSEYEQTTFTIDTNPYHAFLRPYTPPTTKLTIRIRENGLPINESNFRVTLDGRNFYEKNSTSSTIEFDVLPGNYFMSVIDRDSDYGTISRQINVPNTGTTEIVELSKTIKANIRVNVKDSVTKEPIEDAIINLRRNGREIDSRKSGESGIVNFALNDIDDYEIIAKKVGDVGEGYFAKEIKLQNVDSNIEVNLELEKITISNAGQTKIIVVDQDNIPIHNARVVLKYTEDDTLVELNSTRNFAFTDLNGEVTVLAGNVRERVYAYAAKYPFEGESLSKTMQVDQINEFVVIMEIGETPIRLNVEDETGEKINGEARVFDMQDNQISGIINIQNGQANFNIKAGRLAYIKIESEEHVNFYSAPFFLWPERTKNLDIEMKKEISEAGIYLKGIFNENEQEIQTMKAGEKYFALLTIEADKPYSQTLMHFRAGKEELVENDLLYIEKVEAVSIQNQVMGRSFTQNYEIDSQNLTSSIAKWTNVTWENFSGIMQVKVYFKVRDNASPNKEIQFFYRAEFDEIKKPISETEYDLYAETYRSNIYFVGEESICEGDFCITNEWLFDNNEELYIFAPYEIKQVNKYKYNFQIVNNSNTSYGSESNNKPIFLNLSLLGENNKGIKINSLTIREGNAQRTYENVKDIRNLEIGNFERNTVINIEMEIEGLEHGNSVIKTQLRADGLIIFENQRTFSTVPEKQFAINLNRTFIPALLDTEILVEILDDRGDVLKDVDLIVYAKEVGFDEVIIDSAITNRFGKATLTSGAHFTTTTIIIDASKKGFARQRIALTVRDEIIVFNPRSISIELDVISNTEKIQSVQIGNSIGRNLEIIEIKYIAEFNGLVNEGALNAYLRGLIGTKLQRESVSEIDIMRIRLANGVSINNFIEPLNTNGKLILTTRVEGTNVIFDSELLFNLRIVSQSQAASAECLLVSKPKQEKTTERGRVIYTFEMINACTADEVPIPVENIRVSASNNLMGIAELSLQSTTSTKGGRTALDGINRKILDSLDAGEKVVGTLMYTPNTETAGNTIPKIINITANFMGNTITTNPNRLEFTTNVLNLKECMQISGGSGIVAFDSETNITVDATACLGQRIDVYLCYQDSGCSGGAEGTIALSRRNFTLQNSSETINVYSPTIPGSYGITVWARTSGSTNAFSYIGEIPVAFREPETRFFELSKYEVNILGSGTEDMILLTNKVLTQEILVEATNKTWGNKKPSRDWMQIIVGAGIGATLGNMIGSAFGSRSQSSGPKDSPATSTSSNDIKTSVDAISIPNPGDTTTAGVFRNDKTGTISVGDSAFNESGWTRYGTVNVSKVSTPSGGTLTQYDYRGIGSNASFTNSSDLSNHIANEVGSAGAFHRGMYSFFNPTGTSTPTRSPGPANRRGTGGFEEAKPLIFENKESTISFSSNNNISFPSNEIVNNTAKIVAENSISFSRMAGIGTMLGAIAGGLAAYYMDEQARKAWENETQITPYNVYGIFLQGETIEVLSADRSSTNTRTIPSDAGPLGFTLQGVTPSWDFSNADHSSVENVAIKFTNTGLNDPLPKYGTLTINATTTNYGGKRLSADSSFTTTTSSRGDVFCQNPNFGQYWIGSSEEAGSCSPVNKGNYSQKYRIRVISSEPRGAEAQLSKASSCYNGVLVGATGKDALPRIKLNWDWGTIDKDTCAYGNPDYVYCDATQFTISLVKRLAEINEFFRINQNFSCPHDPILDQALQSLREINDVREIVADGRIGAKEVSVAVQNDRAVATVKVQNNTGEAIETFVSYNWTGEGGSVSDQYQTTFPTGESELVLEADTPKFDGVYFFTIVFNGPGGNRRVITHAFENKITDGDCWAQRSTRAQGGVPAVSYYLAEEGFVPVGDIESGLHLYDKVNFGAYLMRDSYSEAFFRDFADYYLTTPLQIISEEERKILEYIKSGKLSITKRFSNQEQVEAGLYDVWFNIDFAENDFRIIDNPNTSVEASVLLIRNPIEQSPFYNIPFNGLVGERERQGYGATYTNQNQEINIVRTPTGTLINTIENSIGNGIINVNTSIESSFEKLNSSVASRGQLASVSFNRNQANIILSPNYATPVIAKYTAQTGQNEMKYIVERNSTPIRTGGNLLFWTGAAQSKNFYGGNAIDTYRESPDYLLEGGEEYGFLWEDITHPTTMYLKTIIYTPTNARFTLNSKDSTTTFLTPNTNFSSNTQLNGIAQMNYNSDLGTNSLNSINDLFDMVKDGSVCLTNDGSNSIFWWNPRVIANTPGTIESLENLEVNLIGTN